MTAANIIGSQVENMNMEHEPTKRFFRELRALVLRRLPPEGPWTTNPTEEWMSAVSDLSYLADEVGRLSDWEAITHEAVHLFYETRLADYLTFPRRQFESMDRADLSYLMVGSATAVLVRDKLDPRVFELVYQPFERFIPADSLLGLT